MATDKKDGKVADDLLREQQSLLQTVIDAVPVPIYYKDEEGVYLNCNAAFATFVGYKIDDIIGKTVYDISPAAFADKNDSSDKNLLRKGGTIVFEAAVKGPDGGLRDIVFHKAVHTTDDGATAGIVGAMLDVTARKEADRQMRHMANHDGLTNVPNRNLGKDRLLGALARARRTKTIAGVLFVDLDGFKGVNDDFGQEAGDKMLKELAKRLGDTVRETDSIARYAADEFTVIVTDIQEREGVAIVAQHILKALEVPFDVNGTERRMGASIGIALYPDDGADPDSLIKAADTAMYKIKITGAGGYAFASEPAESDAAK